MTARDLIDAVRAMTPEEREEVLEALKVEYCKHDRNLIGMPGEGARNLLEVEWRCEECGKLVHDSANWRRAAKAIGVGDREDCPHNRGLVGLVVRKSGWAYCAECGHEMGRPAR
jgi:hypothetical protein